MFEEGERFGRTPGKRPNWKKAYVRLAEGTGHRLYGWSRLGPCLRKSRIAVMPVVKQKPTSPARRGMVRVISTGLHKGRSVPPDSAEECDQRAK